MAFLDGPLFDLTTPTVPLVVTSGVYSVTAIAYADASMTAGVVVFASLVLDAASAFNTIVIQDGLVVQTGLDFPFLVMTATYYLAAGAEVRLNVEHDSVAARDWACAAVVCRLA